MRTLSKLVPNIRLIFMHSQVFLHCEKFRCAVRFNILEKFQMSFLLLADLSAVLSISAIVLLVLCALVAIIGTRLVREKQKQEVRRWRLKRKPTDEPRK